MNTRLPHYGLVLLAVLLLVLLVWRLAVPERKVAPKPVPPPLAAWREQWRDRVEAPPAGPPVWVADGWCAAFRNGTVVSWHADGRRRWTLRQEDMHWTAPAVADDVVILGEEAGNLRALRPSDGAVVWFQPQRAGTLAHAPVTVPRANAPSQIVAMDAGEGRLTAFDAARGVPLWQSEACGRTDGPPAATDGLIAFGNCDAALHLFRASDGRRIARIPLGSDAQMAGGVALQGGKAFVWTRAGTLAAIDLVSTSVVWRATLGDEDYFAAPAADDVRGLVYTGTPSGELLALQAVDGSIRWRRRLAEVPLDAPLLAHDMLFAGADGILHLLSAESGAPIVRFDFGQSLTIPVAAPAVADGVMVITADGYVVVLAPSLVTVR
jgi:outer membrane protein assembly factor BamB